MSEFINTADIIGDDEMCDQIIMRTVTEYKENRITKVGDYAFYNCTQLAEVDLPNVTTIEQYAFNGCTALTELYLQNVTSIGGWAFANTGLISINLPNLISKDSYPFRDCKKLTSVNIPKLTSVHQMFYGCNSLNFVDLPSVTDIGGFAFGGCPLKALILRSSTITNLGTDSIPNPNTWAGYIYVQRSLIDGYKAATNWSAYADHFRAIEDYSVDGTVNGSFFWCSGITLDQTSLTFDSWSTVTLTATMLTPSPHGFDDNMITWSSSDTSVATVNNGVVSPVNKGTAIITASHSHNGYSATCEVVVNVDRSAPIYSLPASKKFNGTSDYVDTGVKLFDEKKSFTIICEADFSALDNANKTLMHCMNEAGVYPGLSVDGQDGVRVCYTGSKSLTTVITTARNNVKSIGLRYVNGVLNGIRYNTSSGEVVSHTVSGSPTYTKVTQNLLLGAYQTTSGTKGRFYNGTIYRCDIYSYALTDVEMDALL